MNKLLFVSVIFLLSSCVSSQKYYRLSGNFQECEKTVETLKEQNQSLKVQNTEFQSRVEKQIKDIEELSAKLDETSRNLENSSLINQRLDKFNTELESQLKSFSRLKVIYKNVKTF